jgi:hypothetical protein
MIFNQTIAQATSCPPLTELQRENGNVRIDAAASAHTFAPQWRFF